ncbi:MAG: serine/threonine-protein phosphatase [Planctomycetes bacterium]|nr:serine/threonine-protein phosphatase [Planctomycetota bacterium]
MLLDDTSLTPDIKDSLDRLGAETIVTSFSVDSAGVTSPPFDARLVLTERPESLTGGRLRKLLAWCDHSPCATLILSKAPGNDAAIRSSGVGNRAIGFASDLSPDELAGRLSAMCSFRVALDQARRELDSARSLNALQQQRIGRLDDELRSASMLQRSLRPMPTTVRGASVRTIYEPADTLSGDICDVTRVDESQVCITLADVTGHGLTSAILSAHVRRSLRGDRDVTDSNGRLCPSQVLRRANRELLESPPQDCQFVTTIVAVFDEDTRMLRWARGGAPYPILLRPGLASEEPARRAARPTWRAELLESVGPLLGVVPEAQFETAEVQLEPGDIVVFHTDGLDACLRESPDAFFSRLLQSPSGVSDPLDKLIARIEARIAAHKRTDTVGLPNGRTCLPGESTHDDVSVVALRVAIPTPTPQGPRESRPVELGAPPRRIDSVRATMPV